MSKLNVDQKNIRLLLADKKADFLIPDYQRPYAWSEEECQTLWEDIFDFAIPEGDATKFNSEEEYLNHLKKLKSKSMYDTGVEVTKDDEILILQTCSTHKDYSNYQRKYLLIILRRV